MQSIQKWKVSLPLHLFSPGEVPNTIWCIFFWIFLFVCILHVLSIHFSVSVSPPSVCVCIYLSNKDGTTKTDRITHIGYICSTLFYLNILWTFFSVSIYGFNYNRA